MEVQRKFLQTSNEIKKYIYIWLEIKNQSSKTTVDYYCTLLQEYNILTKNQSICI